MEPQDILEEVSQPLYPVSAGTRFANSLIDTIIFYIFAFGAGAVIAYFYILSNNEIPLDGVDENSTSFSLISNLVGLLVFFLYYFISEALTARTIGKLITGTVVVTKNGEKPSLKAIAIRSASRLVPFEAFSFLGNNVGWHDKWSDTYVVKKNDVINDL